MDGKESNSNIELLRIVLILMVILLHFNNGEMGGAFNFVQDNFASRLFLYTLESMCICAVNCFMIISGYFLAYNRKVKLGKIVDLLLIVIFYRFLCYFLSIVFADNNLSFAKLVFKFVPANYFCFFYIVTYLLSPFLVKLFDSLNDRQQLMFVSVSCGIFVLWPTVVDVTSDLFPILSLSGISVTNGGTIQFIIDVIIGMYLCRSKFNLSTGKLICIYLISVIAMTIGVSRISSLYGYSSIFTVTSAASLFLLFNKLKFNSKTVNFIAKSVFATFCFHVDPFMNNLWKKYFITESHIGQSFGKMVLWTIISVATMFIVCRFTAGLLKNKICSKCPIIINLEEK